MHFDNEPVEKGLFTFYFEQAKQQQHSSEFKKQRKPKDSPQHPHQDTITINKKKPKRSLQQQPNKLLPSQQHATKSKMESPKQRLMESVIDLTKNAKINEMKQIHKPPHPPPLLRSRQFSLVIKAPQPFLNAEFSLPGSHSQLPFVPEFTREQFNMQSLQRHKLTQRISRCQSKPTNRLREGVVELPPVINEEFKHEDRPRKSLKSKLIQQALHSGDRARIKQIRQFLHDSAPASTEKQEKEGSKSMRVFQMRQEKLLDILQRFRKE